MRAVVVSEPGSAVLASVPDPTPGPTDVIVRVRGCGICGTDLHLVSGDLGTDRFPLIPGHEPWGEVVDCGPEVTNVRVGQLVAVDPSLHCGQCAPCRRGQGNMCEHWGAIGGTKPGAWAEFVRAPAANAYPLPEGMPLDAAALIEPVACAVRGLQRLNPDPDQPAIIFGAGTMGMILSILLEERGVGPVSIVDTNEARRDLARRLTGANVVTTEEVADMRAPWVIEATGNPRAFESAVACTSRAGTVLVFGVASPQAEASVSPYRIYADELTILGSMAILRTFGPAIESVARHADRLLPLLTHRIPLEDISEGLDAVSNGSAVKVVVDPSLAARTT